MTVVKDVMKLVNDVKELRNRNFDLQLELENISSRKLHETPEFAGIIADNKQKDCVIRQQSRTLNIWQGNKINVIKSLEQEVKHLRGQLSTTISVERYGKLKKDCDVLRQDKKDMILVLQKQHDDLLKLNNDIGVIRKYNRTLFAKVESQAAVNSRLVEENTALIEHLHFVEQKYKQPQVSQEEVIANLIQAAMDQLKPKKED